MAVTNELPRGSLESERAVLGSLLIDPDILRELLSTVREEDFLFAVDREIFHAAIGPKPFCSSYHHSNDRRQSTHQQSNGQADDLSLQTAFDMEPIVLIFFHIFRTGDADTPVMADPTAVDDKSFVPIYHLLGLDQTQFFCPLLDGR